MMSASKTWGTGGGSFHYVFSKADYIILWVSEECNSLHILKENNPTWTACILIFAINLWSSMASKFVKMKYWSIFILVSGFLHCQQCLLIVAPLGISLPYFSATVSLHCVVELWVHRLHNWPLLFSLLFLCWILF